MTDDKKAEEILEGASEMSWAVRCRQMVQQIMHDAKREWKLLVQTVKQRAAIIEAGDGGEAQEEAIAMPSGECTNLYEGEVRLIVNPALELPQLLEFEKLLQELPEIKVLRTVGTRDRGNLIYIHLESPTPLLDVLKEIPVVKGAVDELWQAPRRGLAFTLIPKRRARRPELSSDRGILVTLA